MAQLRIPRHNRGWGAAYLCLDIMHYMCNQMPEMAISPVSGTQEAWVLTSRCMQAPCARAQESGFSVQRLGCGFRGHVCMLAALLVPLAAWVASIRKAEKHSSHAWMLRSPGLRCIPLRQLSAECVGVCPPRSIASTMPCKLRPEARSSCARSCSHCPKHQ